MTAEQFAYWLQGFSELNNGPPTVDQWVCIQDHLALVFNKVTPMRQQPGQQGLTPDYSSLKQFDMSQIVVKC